MAHLAHPGECCRASHLCGRSRERGGEARNPGGAGGSHERDPRSPAPPLPGPQWEGTQHWSGRVPEPRAQKQSPLAWTPGEGLAEPPVCPRPSLASRPPDSVGKRLCPNHDQVSVPRMSCRNHVCRALYLVGFCVLSCGRSSTFLVCQPSDAETNLNLPGTRQMGTRAPAGRGQESCTYQSR